MSTDETTAQAGTGTEAPTSTSGTDDANSEQSTTTTPDAPKDSDRTFTQAELNAILKRETKKVADTVKAQIQQEKADAELSEAQKERKRAEEAEAKAEAAETKIAQFTIRTAISMAVADPKLNSRDPKAIALLVNASTLEMDGEDVKGIDAELKRIKAAHPALFYSSSADGAPQGDTSDATDFNAMIRRKAGRG